jgi:hypothetical protein
MGKKKKKKKTGNKILTTALINMLKQVHLGGVINECLLEVVKGEGQIEAVDMTNNLIVVSRWEVMNKGAGAEFGLGNLDLLIRFLGTFDDEKSSFKHSESSLTIKRSDGRRKLSYLLTEPDLISSRLQFDADEEDSDTYETMMEMVQYTAELTPTFLKDYLSYAGMVSRKDTTVVFDGEEKLSFVIGDEDDHQFELVLSNPVEEMDDADEGEFTTRINGEHLMKIFSAIDYDEEEPPTISIADGKPVIIQSGQQEEWSMWALLPLMDSDMEEED